jgi:hypothetical protein
MRMAVLFIVLSQLIVVVARADGRYRELVVSDPFLELRTGPGRGYPVFHVVARSATIEVMRRRTDWFQVRAPRGEEGCCAVPSAPMASRSKRPATRSRTTPSGAGKRACNTVTLAEPMRYRHTAHSELRRI